MKKTYMTATFTMDSVLVLQFTAWMERHYYKKLLETGHFGYAIGKIVDMTDPLKKVCYRLEIQNPTEALAAIKTAEAEFADMWVFGVQKVTSMVLVGEEEELHII